jgi:hypothetical protein
VNQLYSFEPQSLKVFYSSRGLAPWQGAACWIDEKNIPSLQLRESFQKGSFLGIYHKDELLAHEAVHAARAAFEEPQSEEFFAYATSPVSWRRAIGPILRKPSEAWFLFLGLFPPILPILAAFAFTRLILQRLRMKKAADQFDQTDPRKVRALLFRMTDLEICSLSRGKKLSGDSTLRWRLIRLLGINELYRSSLHGTKN